MLLALAVSHGDLDLLASLYGSKKLPVLVNVDPLVRVMTTKTLEDQYFTSMSET